MIFSWEAKVASGTDGEALRPFTEALTVAVAGYKGAASTVRSLLPKAKAKAKAQSKAEHLQLLGYKKLHLRALPGQSGVPWTLVFGPSLSKDNGKVTWKEKDVKEYWEHWQKFGEVQHPATQTKTHVPIGLAGDDAKYTLAGAKIICIMLNFPLREIMSSLAGFLFF
eukprot:s614_g16.t2